MLLHLLPGLDLPPTLPLRGAHMGAWLADVAGVAPGAPRQAPSQNPARNLGQCGGGLPPSVRCGLEAALLSAVAAARGVPLASLLSGDRVSGSQEAASLFGTDEARGLDEAACSLPAAAVNGLIACEGASACAAEAACLVAQGFTTLKMKVRVLQPYFFSCPSPTIVHLLVHTGCAGCAEAPSRSC